MIFSIHHSACNLVTTFLTCINQFQVKVKPNEKKKIRADNWNESKSCSRYALWCTHFFAQKFIQSAEVVEEKSIPDSSGARSVEQVEKENRLNGCMFKSHTIENISGCFQKLRKRQQQRQQTACVNTHGEKLATGNRVDGIAHDNDQRRMSTKKWTVHRAKKTANAAKKQSYTETRDESQIVGFGLENKVTVHYNLLFSQSMWRFDDDITAWNWFSVWFAFQSAGFARQHPLGHCLHLDGREHTQRRWPDHINHRVIAFGEKPTNFTFATIRCKKNTSRWNSCYCKWRKHDRKHSIQRMMWLVLGRDLVNWRFSQDTQWTENPFKHWSNRFFGCRNRTRLWNVQHWIWIISQQKNTHDWMNNEFDSANPLTRIDSSE